MAWMVRLTFRPTSSIINHNQHYHTTMDNEDLILEMNEQEDMDDGLDYEVNYYDDIDYTTQSWN